MNQYSAESLTRGALYELLSAGFLYPLPGTAEMLRQGSLELSQETARLNWPELSHRLEVMAIQLSNMDDRDLEDEYLKVFGHTIATDCPPYETEYDQAHVFQKSQTLAELGAFYHAFSVQVNSQMKERLDHVGVEMEFMNLLVLKEAYAQGQAHGDDKVRICRDAQEKFLALHLAPWALPFAAKLARRCGGAGVLGRLVDVLRTYLQLEFERFRLEANTDDALTPLPVEEELNCAASMVEEDIPEGYETK